MDSREGIEPNPSVLAPIFTEKKGERTSEFLFRFFTDDRRRDFGGEPDAVPSVRYSVIFIALLASCQRLGSACRFRDPCGGIPEEDAA